MNNQSKGTLNHRVYDWGIIVPLILLGKLWTDLRRKAPQNNLPPGSLYYTILTKMHFFDNTLLTNHVYQVHQRVYSNFEQ